MKKYIVALICAALCMPLVSCDKEEQGQFGDNSTYLPISDMENVYPLGDVVEVSFTSASSWSLKRPNWVTIKNKDGEAVKTGYAGTTPLIITIDPYIDENCLTEPSSQPRRGTLEFVTDAGEKTFLITQNRAFIKVVEVDDNGNHSSEDMGSDDIAFDWSEETKRYKVESNVRWMLDVNVDDDVDDNQVSVKVDDIEWESNALYGQNENESDELSITVDYNFRRKINANVSLIPYQPKDEVSTDKSLQDLKRTLKVSQDYLYLQVFKTSPDPSDDLEDLQSAEQIDGFSELGGEKAFYVVYQENLEDEYDINLDASVSDVDTSCFECDKDGDSEECGEIPDGRTIICQKYNAKFSTANPDFENNRTITLAIKPKGTDDPEACRSVKFVQNAYQFVIEEDNVEVKTNTLKEIPNPGDAKYTFTLKTKGDWKISYDEAVNDWASLTFSNANGEPTEVDDKIEVSGSGDATIGVEVANRNLSFESDNVLNLVFEASNINAQKFVKFKQPKFVFNVAVTYNNDTVTEVSSHTKLEYSIDIESSGNWEIETPDEQKVTWVELQGESEGMGNNAISKLSFEPNDGGEPREYVLMVTSKEHAESVIEEYKSNATREVKITQHEMRTNILDEAGGNPYTDPNFSAYYKDGSSDRTKSFYLECSAPWTLTEIPSWLKLYKHTKDGKKEELPKGYKLDDGEYYPMSIEVDNNFDSDGLSDIVNFKADINDHETRDIGFKVTQDGFVFETSDDLKQEYSYEAINNTSDSSFIDDNTFQIKLTKDATIQTDASTNDWVKINIEENKAAETEKTKSYNCTIVPSHNVEEFNVAAREKTIRIGIKDGSQFKRFESVKLSQQSFEWKLKNDTLSPFAVTANDTQVIEIEECTKEGSTICYDVKLKDGADKWLNLTYSDLKVTASTKSINTSTTDKQTGKIVFIVKHSALTNGEELVLHTIDVEQNKYIWSVDYKGETDFDPVYSNSNDYEGKIAIKSSGGWKAEIIEDEDEDDMIKSLSPESGNGDKSVKFIINPNYTRSKRTAKIEISNDDLEDRFNESFEFTQEAYVFKADTESVELEAKKGEGGPASVSFTSSGSKGWTFEVDPVSSDDWLEVKNEDGKLVVTTLKENDTTENKATITVTDVESDLDVVIEVTQKAKAK